MHSKITAAALAACLMTPLAAQADNDHDNMQYGMSSTERANYWIKRADTNNDGWISRNENQAFADRMYEASDADNNGRVTADELAAARDRETMRMKQGMNQTTKPISNAASRP